MKNNLQAPLGPALARGNSMAWNLEGKKLHQEHQKYTGELRNWRGERKQ